MTPEQTLDWLAQQHFDQCCEERPIQDWIRKMKSQLPEQPKQNTVEAVKAVLKGIDQTEIESPDGWWETSAGAEFGAKKLKYVIGLLAQPEQEKERCVGCEACIDTACGRDECPKGWPKAAQPEQEPTNLERHKRNVQKFLGTQQPKEPEQDEYLSKAYRLANELRCHLAIAPAPQRTWVGLTKKEVYDLYDSDYAVFHQRIEAKLKEKNT